MSALKVLLKFNPNKKHRHKGSSTPPLGRSSSNQQIKHSSPITTLGPPVVYPQFRSRSQTFAGTTLTKPQETRRVSNTDQPGLVRQAPVDVCDEEHLACLEDMQMTLTSPRHYLRRRALVGDELQDDVSSSTVMKCANGFVETNAEGSSSLTINLLAEGHKITETVATMPSHSVTDLVDYVLVKHDIDLNKGIEEYSVTGTTLSSAPGHSVAVSLGKPSSEYAGYMITLKDIDASEIPQKPSSNEAPLEEEKAWVFTTVQDCLDYFDEHGLVELPLPNEEESFQLPRVTPLEPIAREWESLPIDPQTRNALSDKDMEQQRAIWELIHNEYSHLKTLETIINVFMRCLELIHRAKVFAEDNYHNIFGYMEDLYHAHDQLWTYTLEPCLTKTYETKCPLDIGEIMNRFPQSFGRHFEIYEQHCTLDSSNTNLQKATSSAEFNTYLNWCEARSECNRQKLKEMLAKPMQQITRYHLLINAIIKKTIIRDHKERLEKILEEVTSFVHAVDNGLRMQDETERVKDVMARITTYSVGDVPNELRELVQSYTHLDLLAPMPDVELDKPRLLMVEGSLHYRDSVKPKMSAVYVFLFTDMVLITKAIRKSSTDKYKVIHAPYKITSLVVHSLTSESICCLVLSDYNVLSSWFILKANSATVAEEWLKQITAAQQFYQDAMNKKAQTWKLMENLRSERILNGVENLDSLSASLSQSLWSINSLTNKKYDDLSKRSSTPSLNHQIALTKSGYCDYSSKTMGPKPKKSKYKNFRSMTGSLDLTKSLVLQRTSSLGGIATGQGGIPDTNKGRPSSLSGFRLLNHSYTAGLTGLGNYVRTGHVNTIQDQTVRRSPTSDSSSTEGSETSLYDECSRDTGISQSSDDQKSATLPRPSKPRQSVLPMSKSLSHSPVDLNESLHMGNSNLSLKDMAQRFPDSTNPLQSLLRLFPKPKKDMAISRTRSHGEVERTSRSSFSISPIPPTIDIISSSLPMEELDTDPHNEPTIRKKCNSVGSLEVPDLNQLFQKPTDNGGRKSVPCLSKRNPGSLVGALSSSEGCLFTPTSDSYFNIVYIRDAYSRSQKPNVETVDEEEESQTKTKNDSLEEPEDMDKSLASSSCTEVPLHKSCEELDTETEHAQSSDDDTAEKDGEEKKEADKLPVVETDLQGCSKTQDSSKEPEAIGETCTHVSKSDMTPQFKEVSPILEKPDNNSVNKQASKELSPEVEKFNRLENAVKNKPKFLLSIPEMAISDVDAVETQMTLANKAKYIFKDMREMSSFSETESDLESDQTAKDKFTLLHSWRTFESVSIESDDYLSSPTSMDEPNFSITEKKTKKKANTLSEKYVTVRNTSETPSSSEETIPEQTSEKKTPSFQELLFPVPSTSPTADDPVSPKDKYVTYSPLMKKKQHLPAMCSNTKEPAKLKEEPEEDSNAKSKVKQLSKMFEVKQQTTKESSTVVKGREASPVRKFEPGMRLNYSPSSRIKKISMESNSPVEISRNQLPRKESFSKIPVVGDKKKHRTLNGHVKKDKSPEPTIAADKLLPSKPSFRNQRLPVSGRSTKHGAVLVESMKIPPPSKDSGPIIRVSSAPQARTKTKSESATAFSNSQETKRKTEHTQELNSQPCEVQEPRVKKSSTAVGHKPKVSGVLEMEVISSEELPRKTSTSEEKRFRTVDKHKLKSASTQEPKLKSASDQETKRKRNSLPESKSKSSFQEPKGLKARSNSAQVLKSKPSRTQEPRIKTGTLLEPVGRVSSGPDPKPKPSKGYASKPIASHHWDLQGKPSTLMEPKTRVTTSKPPCGINSSLQRLNGNHFYIKQTSVSKLSNTNSNNNSKSECYLEGVASSANASPISFVDPKPDTTVTQSISPAAGTVIQLQRQNSRRKYFHHLPCKGIQSNT